MSVGTGPRGPIRPIFGRSFFESTASALPLGWARCALGAVVGAKAWHLATMIPALTTTGAVRVPYLSGFEPGHGLLVALASALGASGIALTIGWRSRAAAATAAVLLTLWLVADRQLYANHLYLLILLTALLAMSECGAVRSLDRFRSEPYTTSGAATGASRIPAWPVALLKFQLTIVYAFAALAKLNASYLSGEALGSFTDRAPVGTLPPLGLQTLAVGSVVVELFVAFGLWSRRTRALAAAAGVVLHAGMLYLIDYPLPLWIFAASLVALYPLFFSDDP